MKLFIIFSMAFCFNVLANDLIVDNKNSQVSWHLYIDKGTNVYGEIPIISGNLNFTQKSGALKFDLAATKSWELEDGKKEFSSSRDSRIKSITTSEENIPSFTLTDVTGLDKSKDENQLEITGKLFLNGVTKKIQLNAILKKNTTGQILTATHKIIWEEYEIGNPVLWILRATSTPQDFITLKFELNLK